LYQYFLSYDPNPDIFGRSDPQAEKSEILSKKKRIIGAAAKSVFALKYKNG
jgi:hypothetical protein